MSSRGAWVRGQPRMMAVSVGAQAAMEVRFVIFCVYVYALYVFMYVYICMCICVCVFFNTHAIILHIIQHIFICMCTCMYMYAYVCAHSYT